MVMSAIFLNACSEKTAQRSQVKRAPIVDTAQYLIQNTTQIGPARLKLVKPFGHHHFHIMSANVWIPMETNALLAICTERRIPFRYRLPIALPKITLKLRFVLAALRSIQPTLGQR